MQEQFSEQLAQAIYKSLGNNYGVKTVHGSDNERLSINEYEKGTYRESASMLKLHIEEGWYFEPQVFPPSALAYLVKHYIADKNAREQHTISYIMNWSLSDTIKLFKSSQMNETLALSFLNQTYMDKFSIRPEEKSEENTLKQSYILNLCHLIAEVSNNFSDQTHTEALAHYLNQRQNEIKDSRYMINLCETLVQYYPHELNKFQSLDIVRNHLQATQNNEFEIEDIECVWTIKLDLKKFQHVFLLPSWTVKEYAYVMNLLMQEIEKNGMVSNKGVQDVLMQNKYNENSDKDSDSNSNGDNESQYKYSIITVNQTKDSTFSHEGLSEIIKATFHYLKEHNRQFSFTLSNPDRKKQKEIIVQDLQKIVKKIMFYQNLNQSLQPYEESEHHDYSPSNGKLKI